MESRSVRKVDDDEALSLARCVAERLMASAGDAERTTDLGQGAPGVALALRYAAEVFDDDRYLKAGHRQLRRTAETSATAPLTSAGLYSGTAGFVWVVAEYARLEPRYLPTLATMTDRLSGQAMALKLPLSAGSVADHDYDVIMGAAGRLATLLKAADVLGAPATGAAREATDSLVDYLLDLTHDDGGKPRWFCAPSRYPSSPGTDGSPVALPWYSESFPNGMYNLGFAHGLPGILAALCRADAAHTAGVPGVSGIAGRSERGAARAHRVRQRIRDIVRQLDAWRVDRAGHPTWASALPPDPDTGLPDITAFQPPGRAAWCYGAPGVAVSLLSASAVGGDPDVADLATAALAGVERTSAEQRRLYSPTVCHGLSGLLAVCVRAAAQTRAPGLREMCDDLRSRLCAHADPDHPYLFAEQPEPGKLAHRAGLLSGAAGVLLTLLGTVSPAAAQWDEVLFLTQSDVRA
ncbi:lanthionine synthetase C family protein [Streptomyces sp. NBC_01795]|uniref:lanthionine synthetase C family protein n=1 Tax=unclassified Streptomyces TaxID=2593676 RepID=UPI002DD7DC99|nr:MULTISPECIES: lanthionine synthetase C family protein [unclassified Streptomyces]WSA91419.1 lanthionine synthetase C family protein [Streptomyces sp. NBC_01795]WSS15972.1 lanthionine synthetase C family protein [Streptomyces sp. NBC_01186]